MSDRIRTQPPPFQALASDPPGESEAPAFCSWLLCQTLPNSAQKPRRGRRVSVPRPFNGDFDGTNLVEFTHRIPRRRYDREAVPICGTRARIAGRSASVPVPTDRVAHPASSDDAARAHARRDRSHPFPSRAVARIDRHPRFPASIPRLTGPAPPAFSQA